MEIKVISLSKNHKYIASGKFGSYFRLSKNRGLKMLSKGFMTKEEARKSYFYQQAKKEVVLLQQAEPSGISPRYSELLIAKFQGLYFPAIKMEHVKGRTLESYNHKVSIEEMKVNVKTGKLIKRIVSQKRKSAYSFVNSLLLKQKIKHLDIHECNVLVEFNGKIRVIDFSPRWVSLIK